MLIDELDQYYGFRTLDIETELLARARRLRPQGNLSNFGDVLHGGNQTWVGLEPQTLNTPYEELVHICHLLDPKPGESMVDLGAGYGRMGVVLHELYPGTLFIGFELVKERVNDGNRVFQRLGTKTAKLLVQNLNCPKFTLPDADYFFLYDFGKVSHIRETLKLIEAKSRTQSFVVIARGKASRSLIEFEHPWLATVYPGHQEKNFSIYSWQN